MSIVTLRLPLVNGIQKEGEFPFSISISFFNLLIVPIPQSQILTADHVHNR